MRYADITYPDISNGSGVRVSVFTQGCPIRCKGCFNQELWDETKGKEWNEETTELLLNLLDNKHIKGITWLGGEPSIWSKEIALINWVIKDKYPDKDIWLYTGNDIRFLSQELKDSVDVIVDGKYEESNRDITKAFRGSTNQRIWVKDHNNNIWWNKTKIYDEGNY